MNRARPKARKALVKLAQRAAFRRIYASIDRDAMLEQYRDEWQANACHYRVFRYVTADDDLRARCQSTNTWPSPVHFASAQEEIDGVRRNVGAAVMLQRYPRAVALQWIQEITLSPGTPDGMTPMPMRNRVQHTPGARTTVRFLFGTPQSSLYESGLWGAAALNFNIAHPERKKGSMLSSGALMFQENFQTQRTVDYTVPRSRAPHHTTTYYCVQPKSPAWLATEAQLGSAGIASAGETLGYTYLKMERRSVRPDARRERDYEYRPHGIPAVSVLLHNVPGLSCHEQCILSAAFAHDADATRRLYWRHLLQYVEADYNSDAGPEEWAAEYQRVRQTPPGTVLLRDFVNSSFWCSHRSLTVLDQDHRLIATAGDLLARETLIVIAANGHLAPVVGELKRELKKGADRRLARERGETRQTPKYTVRERHVTAICATQEEIQQVLEKSLPLEPRAKGAPHISIAIVYTGSTEDLLRDVLRDTCGQVSYQCRASAKSATFNVSAFSYSTRASPRAPPALITIMDAADDGCLTGDIHTHPTDSLTRLNRSLSATSKFRAAMLSDATMSHYSENLQDNFESIKCIADCKQFRQPQPEDEIECLDIRHCYATFGARARELPQTCELDVFTPSPDLPDDEVVDHYIYNIQTDDDRLETTPYARVFGYEILEIRQRGGTAIICQVMRTRLVDNGDNWLRALKELREELGIPVRFPSGPDTKERLDALDDYKAAVVKTYGLMEKHRTERLVPTVYLEEDDAVNAAYDADLPYSAYSTIGSPDPLWVVLRKVQDNYCAGHKIAKEYAIYGRVRCFWRRVLHAFDEAGIKPYAIRTDAIYVDRTDTAAATAILEACTDNERWHDPYQKIIFKMPETFKKHRPKPPLPVMEREVWDTLHKTEHRMAYQPEDKPFAFTHYSPDATLIPPGPHEFSELPALVDEYTPTTEEYDRMADVESDTPAPLSIRADDAGSGKTYLAFMVAKHRAIARGMTKIISCSFTCRLSKEHRRAAAADTTPITWTTMTISSLLQWRPGVEYNGVLPTIPSDVAAVVVDEVLMSNRKCMAAITRCMARHRHILWIFTSDECQLKPIDNDYTREDQVRYLAALAPRTITLHVNKRQAGLPNVFKSLRTATITDYESRIAALRKTGVAWTNGQDAIADDTATHICLSNARRNELHDTFMAARGREGKREGVERSDDYRPGDRVRTVDHFYHTEEGTSVNIGSMEELVVTSYTHLVRRKDENGKVSKKGEYCVTVRFPEGGGRDMVVPTEILALENVGVLHGYQGATVQGKIYIHEWAHKHADAGWLYTALTRCTHPDNVSLVRRH